MALLPEKIAAEYIFLLGTFRRYRMALVDLLRPLHRESLQRISGQADHNDHNDHLHDSISLGSGI